MSYIYIVPIKLKDPSCIEPLKNSISRTFQLDTKIRESAIDLSSAFDPARNQYNSSLILLQLITNPPRDTLKILGVSDVDLCIPILTFVFGEAQLNGIGAVVSLHRLDSQYYGLPKDENLLRDRLIKEAIHELGHTFGLVHCEKPHCVMNVSTYVEDIDQKTKDFCSSCFRSIKTQKFR